MMNLGVGFNFYKTEEQLANEKLEKDAIEKEITEEQKEFFDKINSFQRFFSIPIEEHTTLFVSISSYGDIRFQKLFNCFFEDRLEIDEDVNGIKYKLLEPINCDNGNIIKYITIKQLSVKGILLVSDSYLKYAQINHSILTESISIKQIQLSSKISMNDFGKIKQKDLDRLIILYGYFMTEHGAKEFTNQEEEKTSIKKLQKSIKNMRSNLIQYYGFSIEDIDKMTMKEMIEWFEQAETENKEREAAQKRLKR